MPPTGDLASKQVPAPPETMLAMASIWAGGQDDQVAKPGISSRAQGKVPAGQVE